MRCPACLKDRIRDDWSPAQWKHWDPWREKRNCCVVCQDGQDKYERNTWHTDATLKMTKDAHEQYVRPLREGWEQGQQSSRTSQRPQRSRSRSRPRTPWLPAPANSVWGDQTEWQGRATASDTTLAVPNSPVSSGSTVVSVQNQWNEMELRVVPNAMQCPPAKDPHDNPAMFQRVAGEKIDTWKRNAYDRQMVDQCMVNKTMSWKPTPVYQIDFDRPTYNPEQATVTFPVNRQDLLPLSFLLSICIISLIPCVPRGNASSRSFHRGTISQLLRLSLL